jgi:serine/threonine protein phosphatase PrpC
LCRGGEALRLTYDHKGSDAQESKRIMDAGGFVMNNRVNGGVIFPCYLFPFFTSKLIADV